MSAWPHETPPGRCVHWPRTCAEVQSQTATCFKFCEFCCATQPSPQPAPDLVERVEYRVFEVLSDRLERIVRIGSNEQDISESRDDAEAAAVWARSWSKVPVRIQARSVTTTEWTDLEDDDA